MGSLPVTPRHDCVFQKEPIDSWDSQGPLETKPDISPVCLNNKRKRKATSPCERPKKSRKRTNRQPILSSRICVKEDVEDANTSNGGWEESELDKNLKQLSLTVLISWDDPFVDAHPRPPPRNKAGSTATKSTSTDISKEKQRLREATLARMEEINEKLQPWENGATIMTRAQAQEVDRLCDEYSQICAALPPPQDFSPSASSALPQSHSSCPTNDTDNNSDSYSNTSGDSSGTKSQPIGSIMALRTKQDFKEYHERQKIKFGRKNPEDYDLMDMDCTQLKRRGREEMLSIVLGNEKGRLRKYWDWLAQRSGRWTGRWS